VTRKFDHARTMTVDYRHTKLCSTELHCIIYTGLNRVETYCLHCLNVSTRLYCNLYVACRLLHEDVGRQVPRPVEPMVRLHRLSSGAGSSRRLSTRHLDGNQQTVRCQSAVSSSCHSADMHTLHRPQTLCSARWTRFIVADSEWRQKPLF